MEKKIVFPELRSIDSDNGCVGCYGDKYHRPSTECLLSRFAEDNYLINCDHDGIIFVLPEKWEQCTRENTNIGDEVRHVSRNQKLIVTYMFESGTIFVGKTSCNMEDLKQTSEYLVNTNR